MFWINYWVCILLWAVQFNTYLYLSLSCKYTCTEWVHTHSKGKFAHPLSKLCLCSHKTAGGSTSVVNYFWYGPKKVHTIIAAEVPSVRLHWRHLHPLWEHTIWTQTRWGWLSTKYIGDNHITLGVNVPHLWLWECHNCGSASFNAPRLWFNVSLKSLLLQFMFTGVCDENQVKHLVSYKRC